MINKTMFDYSSITTVMVVDDSLTDRTNMQNLLKAVGIQQIIIACSGEECLNIIQNNKPDLIFLDVIMPEMDGYRTCRELKNDTITNHIPVVFVTSKGQRADMTWGKMLGCSGYLVKPATPDALQSILQKMHKHLILNSQQAVLNV
ncbi:MAG: response regulator [Mariprofundales bacterium]